MAKENTAVDKIKSPRKPGTIHLLRLCQAEFILADAVIPVMVHYLIEQVLGNIHEGHLILNADLANGVAGDIRMIGDRADDIIWADSIRLA